MTMTQTPPKAPNPHLVLALTKNQCDLACNYTSHSLRRELLARYEAPHTLVNLEDSYALVQDGLNTVYRHIRRGPLPMQDLEAAALLAAREALALLVAVRAQQVAA